ncbi:hypothetical protein WJX72_004206 [[Myrmecia] bisecta]|uniref:Uncharacterized protein n=1 Tax=[Myrmecia] bisecta TaxID=41462 RepID=A0AAW1R5W0_9CHLO
MSNSDSADDDEAHVQAGHAKPQKALTSLARLSSRAGLGLTHEQLISSDRRPSSLLEASARRLALAKHRSEAALNSSAQSIPQQFIDAYMEAVKAGDAQWASAALVSGLFAEQAKMVTQDKQTYHGKPAVVRRLNKGMETLLRMAGQEAADAAPDFTVEGPSETASGTWLVTYIFKRGMAKYRVVNEFTIVAGEITHLRSSRA